jgi:predicted AlkP superfamily phosphohydrolase/phosphomutase
MGADTRTRPPLVIVALDGADLDFVHSWMREGRLPTLASVVGDGCWGTTAGPEHVCEHGSWVSVFSGRSRHEHGYFSYRQLEAGSYAIHPSTPREARARPFWEVLQGTERRVAIVDAPEVTPVAGLAGVQLTNWASHQPDMAVLDPEAVPHALLEEARRVFGGNQNISEYEPRSSVAADLAIFERLLERVERRGALYRALLERADPELAVIGFFEAHKASHRFWDYRPGATGDLARTDIRLENAIRDVYEATDRELAAILGKLVGERNVVILSTYGMKDEYPTSGLMDAFMRELGYQPAANSSGESAGALALARRLVPLRLRDGLSRRLPAQLQERLLADNFRHSTDWPATTAFALPSLFTSFIRVNLRGREPEGVVAPGQEYRRMLELLEADLRALVDPVDGRPAVHGVTRTVDAFGGEPPSVLPDLFVEWTPTTHLRRRLEHPRASIAQAPPDYLRSNEHSHHGFFAAAGPSIHGRGDVGEISILDLAPTFLSLLGIEGPADLPGSTLSFAKAG